MTQDKRRNTVAELLRQAGQAHHDAFAHVNGEDPEWPAWYAAYLAELLSPELGVRLERRQLAEDLAALEAERQARAPGADWSPYYAAWLVQRYVR